MSPALQELMRSPLLPERIEELHNLIEGEKRKRQEFRHWVKPHTKAEFINGDIVLHSPARHLHHLVRVNLERIIGIYVSLHRVGVVVSEKALCVFPRNDYEPDIAFFLAAKVEKLTPETMEYPPPDWIIEVLSPSSEHYDRGVKFTDYAAHGVEEYWIVAPEMKTIEQYEASDGTYRLVAEHAKGTVKPRHLPGFEIPIAAVFDDSAHRAFIGSLAKSG